jgi:hypothetical protein
MDFGPVLLNKQHNRNNDGGHRRMTTETFQMATAVLFQSPIQNFGITPNNLKEQPSFVIDFMKKVPTLWDETLFMDGYPGKYAVLARRHGEQWYVAAINAGDEVKEVAILLPMLSGQTLTRYTDNNDRTPQLSRMRVGEEGEIRLTVQPGGGTILTNGSKGP